MGKINLLIDTDIFIDYFNHGQFSNILENKSLGIYYSAITKKELLSKKGLKASEKEATLYTLKKFRLVKIDKKIAGRYSELRNLYPFIQKEDALIAATALEKDLTLVTRNYRHYRNVDGLRFVRKRC